MPYEVVLDSYNVDSVVTGFAGFFGTKVIDERSERKLEIPRAHGKGVIRAVDFRDGLSMLIFDCFLRKDLKIRYRTKDLQPLRLIFCVRNDFKHIIQADRMQYQLTNLLGSMVSGTRQNDQVFLIPAEKEIHYYCIEIDRKRYNQKVGNTISTLPVELRDVFSDTEGVRPFLYQGHFSLTIAQCIQNMSTTVYQGLVKRIYMESQTLEIMAMQVKQYIDDLAPSTRQSVLRKRDMELIIEARNRLLADLINPPTIRELAHLTGTNENKLKKGFRILYNTSINKLLQNERLSKAKLLIAEQSYPIREIARMVGYRHSGHFTAKFKKRFGCLPKDYIKSMTV
jgi:AraC-like DNA-binding protein